MMDYKEMTQNCIKCKACTNHCTFLTKYNIDVGDIEELYELSYHCFLCGKCDEVCPMDIKCRDIILDMRRDRVRKGENPKGYTPLIAEKNNYIFKNYRSANKKSVLFPGCNFPSFFPKTTKHLVELFAEHDIGVIYDCCGKPISELGMEKSEKNILNRIREQIENNEIEEIILLCPNCYYYFNGELNCKITFIYDKLRELGIGNKMVFDKTVDIFPPCPDRRTNKLLKNMADFIDGDHRLYDDVQCCGLGGVAIVKERELAKEMTSALAEHTEHSPIYTYCATCCGNIARAGGKEVYHFLIEILGTGEKPDIKKSVFNRAKTKLL